MKVRSQSIVFVHLRRVQIPKPTPTPVHQAQRFVRHNLRMKPKIVLHAQSKTTQGARARNSGRTNRAAHGLRKISVHHEIAKPTAVPALPTAAHIGVSLVAGVGAMAGASGAHGSGSGGNAGVADDGNGSGVSGKGTGDGIAPCGSIYITRRGPIKTFDGFEHVRVGIQVQLKDGSLTPEVPLPYPLLYGSDAQSPFSVRNRSNPAFPTLLQPPPGDMDTADFPAIIKLVLAHTTPEGYTLFEACPTWRESEGPP